METLPKSADTVPPFLLESVEIELAIDVDTLGSASLEEALRKAVETVGGLVLFHVIMAADETHPEQCVAAAAFGTGSDHELAILTLSADGTVTTEPASQSTAPIAAIAPAFAGLAGHWMRAA